MALKERMIMAKNALARRFAEIRALIATVSTAFGKVRVDDKVSRRKKAISDLRYFAETYFPHYLSAPASAMHKEFFRRFQDAILHGNIQKLALAAPRGHAKSTISALILPLWCIVTESRRFIAILSDTGEQANEFLEFIKSELENNERLREDFPSACGLGRTWKTGHIITANRIKVRCWGTGQSLRGARHGSSRPDLVICDDLENDDQASAPEQRRKMENWFVKAVMKMGSRKTVFIVVGTILHYDSLLAKLLQRPGWLGRKFKAIIKYSVSPLWEKWERLYAFVCNSDIMPVDSVAANDAEVFFKSHKTEMLAHTEVLWPEVEDYLYLMKMRVSDGPAAFDSEKQNEPINPSDCLFNEEWFRYWDQRDGAELETLPAPGGIWCAVDPSMGKQSTRADPSAILIGAVREGGFIDILAADIKKRHPDAIMEALFEYHKTYNFARVVIEDVQFQELFKDQLLKESTARGVYMPVEGIKPVADKILRITKLQPQIKNGCIRFRRDQKTLLDQLKYFPKADHDDGPDALEMLLSLIIRGRSSPRVRVVEPQYPEPTRPVIDAFGSVREIT